MKNRKHFSIAEARRIALAAQGFSRPRPSGPANRRHIRRAIETVACLQLDFVNVLLPAHQFILWSRLGGYPRAAFHDVVYRSGEFTEQWAHEASVVPVSCWPLLHHRRSQWRIGKRSPLNVLGDPQPYLQDALQQVAASGPLTAADLPQHPGPKRKPGDWHRSIARCALEYHFGCGNVAVHERQSNFQRVYDIAERLIPGEHLQQQHAPLEADIELLRRSARAHGIGALHDLADYFRMPPNAARQALQGLLQRGDVREVSIDGWSEPAYLHVDAKLPRTIGGHSLLSPFDPLVWFRPRAQRLFDFDYRIEIYVPASKRRWGYYVLPFRMADELVARVDLKADRQKQILLVRQAHLEPGQEPHTVAKALASELRELATWLNLGNVRIARKRKFEMALRKVL